MLRLWKKTFLREIYRNIQTFAISVLQESSSLASGNGAVQMFFLTPNKNMFAGKFVNWESFLAVFWEHFIFNFIRVEICKISVVFWTKLYCKTSDIFRWLLLALRFSATNSGIKKTLMMSTGTCGLKLYARNNILKKKKNYKYELLNHLYFGPSFVFRRTALGCFFIFHRRSTMVANIFTQPTFLLKEICK